MIPVERVSQYTSLIRDSHRIPDPPAFTFGAFPSDAAAYYYGATYLQGMGVHVLRDVGHVRGYVVDASNEFLFGGDVQVHPGDVEAKRAAIEPLLAQSERRRVTGRAAAIVGPGTGYGVYGHWIAEYLPRLAMLHLAGYNVAELIYPIPKRTPAFARALLALAGVPEQSLLPVDDTEIVQFDELLIPTSPHSGVRYAAILKDVAAFLRAGIARSGQAMPHGKTPSRIFLARSGSNRALRSRAAIEQLATENRFSLVYPEKLGFLAQVALFENAREIAGEYGSAFHTALFSPPGTVLCGLRGDSVHPGFLQSGFARELDHHMGYVFGHNTNDPGEYDYDIDPAVAADAFRVVFSGPARLYLRASAAPRPAGVPPAADLDAAPAAIPAAEPARTSVFARLKALFSRPPPAPLRPPAGTGVHESLFGAARRKPSRTAAPATPLPVLAHVQNIGDMPAADNGWAGEIGSGNAIEGFEILAVPGLPDDCLTCSAINPDKSASPRVPLGGFCGTRGANKPLLGFCLHLHEAWRDRIIVTTDAQFTDNTELRDVPAGLPCEAQSGATLESFRIKLARLPEIP